MKKVVFLTALFITSIYCYSQKFEINSDGLFLDTIKITKQTNPSRIKSILGNPDRISSKSNIIWTYDKIGVMVYINPKNGKLKSFSFDFKKQGYDFSPKKTFSGELLIYGTSVSKNTPVATLQKIPDLDFKKSIMHMYSLTTNYLKLTLIYLHDVNKLESMEISFNEQ